MQSSDTKQKDSEHISLSEVRNEKTLELKLSGWDNSLAYGLCIDQVKLISFKLLTSAELLEYDLHVA